MDPSLTTIVPFVLVSAFSRATLDLKFNSTAELPELYRKLLLNPHRVRNLSPEEKKLSEVPEECLKVLESVEGPIEIVASLSEMASIRIELQGKDFAAFIREFGNSALVFLMIK